MSEERVRVTMFVAVDPRTAFAVFTEHTDAWWRTGFKFRGVEGSTIRFEHERRLIEESPGGAVFEIGQVLAWQPGVRLAFEWRGRDFDGDACLHATTLCVSLDGGETGSCVLQANALNANCEAIDHLEARELDRFRRGQWRGRPHEPRVRASLVRAFTRRGLSRCRSPPPSPR